MNQSEATDHRAEISQPQSIKLWGAVHDDYASCFAAHVWEPRQVGDDEPGAPGVPG